MWNEKKKVKKQLQEDEPEQIGRKYIELHTKRLGIKP